MEPSTLQPLLEVRNLKTYFFTEDGVVKAVDDVSFSVVPGEVLGLVGESGCGKSVTSLSVMRLVGIPGKIIGGDILFDGKELLKLPEGEMVHIRGKLYLFAGTQQVTATGDALFPAIALHHMPKMVSVIFIIALISALFPSADGAITALTSSFCIDILGMQRRNDWNDAQKKKIRQRIHLGVACLFLLFVMVYKWVDSSSMIGVILKVAAYTYGPYCWVFSLSVYCSKEMCRTGWCPSFVYSRHCSAW